MVRKYDYVVGLIMILIDYSSILHRKIFTSITNMKPSIVDGKYVTQEFIGFTKYQILEELFKIEREYGAKYGELVICMDNKSPEGYWRVDVLSTYKQHRSKNRQESDIDFSTVWPEINALTEVIVENLPWRCIEVHRAEADDIILVIASEFKKFNPILDYSKPLILIHSPDKDMIQEQDSTGVIHQYSALTNKWIEPENKNSNMKEWLMEHVCLGDKSDDVPKIVDNTEFSDNFIIYLEKNGIKDLTPPSFKASKTLSKEQKVKLLTEYDVYNFNRAGEQQEKDIYKKISFGPKTLTKKIKEFGSLDNFIDSNPQYRYNYERNKKLVLTEGIPDYIREGVLKAFAGAKYDYNFKAFEEYLSENNLSSVLMELPSTFSSKRGELTAEDFW